MKMAQAIRTLEHSTLKLPYESMNKKFRSTQKVLDREISHVSGAIAVLDTRLAVVETVKEQLKDETVKEQLKDETVKNDVKVENNDEESKEDTATGKYELNGQENLQEDHKNEGKDIVNEDKNSRKGVDNGSVVALIDGVVEKLISLKRKSVEAFEDEMAAATCCLKRVVHLKGHDEVWSKNGLADWKAKRFDRMLVDYFLRKNFFDTGIKLAESSGIRELTNIDMFIVSREIEECLRVGDTGPALQWCHDNRSKLRRIKSKLEFKLREQEFIELIKGDERLEAIKHARKYLATMATEDSMLDHLQTVMGILAFPRDTHISPYKQLYSDARWEALVLEFQSNILALHQLTDDSVFSVTLQAGLSSLKTPHCYREGSRRHPECPVCNPRLNDLAASLPSAHCSQSRLVCPVSGLPMNEHNAPMMLPNGRVYSYDSLQSLAGRGGGKFKCPKTGEEFVLEQAEKVFVM